MPSAPETPFEMSFDSYPHCAPRYCSTGSHFIPEMHGAHLSSCLLLKVLFLFQCPHIFAFSMGNPDSGDSRTSEFWCLSCIPAECFDSDRTES